MAVIFSVTKADTYYFKGWMATIRVVKLDCPSKIRMLIIGVPKK